MTLGLINDGWRFGGGIWPLAGAWQGVGVIIPPRPSKIEDFQHVRVRATCNESLETVRDERVNGSGSFKVILVDPVHG
ncbi:hypothetical protein RRF57_012038 [Xylaria bambusicola]|uniref:Uncharacterized protein n=1 Tax=Xylaria bambusicola TaxID=326684 RepID=A0AAN7V061_9PEZI